jgi:hypothetical protein
MRINLNDPDIMDSKEAVTKWGIDDSTLRKRKDDFPEGSIRKIGTSWAVTREGMENIFGKLKGDEEMTAISEIERIAKISQDHVEKLDEKGLGSNVLLTQREYIEHINTLLDELKLAKEILNDCVNSSAVCNEKDYSTIRSKAYNFLRR